MIIGSISLACAAMAFASYKFLTRRSRHPEINFDFITDEYAMSLQLYKENGRKYLKEFNEKAV